MIFKATVKKHLAGLLFFSFFSYYSIAQKADFTADKTGGCSPLDVRFTNTSTGLSANADYKWEFGNSNTSKLVSPGTTYKEEKTYTVKLTVTDAGKTYTKTMDITVYKKPRVNFEADVSKGCLPLAVTFTSKSEAGDGSISSNFWDFGDGATQSGNQQIQHIYNNPQTINAGLTVTNSYGCYNTLTKDAIVKVLPSVKADFTASEFVLCKLSDAAKFNNNSTGPGTLSYTWNFGDNQTSTDKNPSHVYSNKGSYTIKLTVNSSEGCSAEITKNAYVNAANFNSDFNVPPLICENSTATFTDKSSPAASSQAWLVNGAYSYYYSSQFPYTPSSAGSSVIQLINTYGSCSDTATKNITIKAAPKIDGFIADMQGICGSPVTIKFKDTTKASTKWEWDFDGYYYNFNPTAFVQEPSYTYNSDGSYPVMLRVSNADGCSTDIIKMLSIYKTNAHISSSAGTEGCESLTTTFSANSDVEIKEYSWKFGDGSTSTVPKPQYTFSKAGNYTITLEYVNANGCKGIATNHITIYAKPDSDFTASPGTTICGNNPVTFTATGTNIGSTYYFWNFGDNTYDNYQYNSTVTHQYFSDNSYTVSLIIANGTCVDTVTKNDYIKVLPPFPKISEVINTCEGNRGTVTFKETSKKTNKWTWDFGDDSTPVSYTSAQPEIKYSYTKTGTYKVVLTATNGECSVRDSTTVYVLLKQNPVLTSSQTEVCSSAELNTNVAQFETNPAPHYSYYSDYGLSKIEYADKSAFAGYYSTPNYTWRNSFQLNLKDLDVTKKDIRVITQSYYFNCADTTNFIPLKIKGPFAGFDITGNNVCFKSPVIFKDTSKSANDVEIVKWEWNYGDGRSETLTKGGSVAHKYDNPGSYYILLKVTDKDGCSSSSQNYNYANVKGPKADFTMSPNPVSPETTVYFYNNTNTANTNYYDNTYTWLFGDGTSSKDDYSTSHFYTESGIDTVRLIATNKAEGCTDTAVQYLHIKNLNLAYSFKTTFINPASGCPPVLATFQNISVNTTSISWDFGDGEGSTAGNSNTVSHTYQKPGVYKVTLYGYFDNGTMDSTFDFITIVGPYASLKVDKLYSCGADNITLTAEARNTSSFTWDFGDGTLLDIADTFATHKYLTPGVYTPALIVKDSSGCSFPFFLEDKIIIDTLDFSITKMPPIVCDSGSVNFIPDIVSLAKNELQQPLQYFWNFGTANAGDTSVNENPSFIYNSIGSYPVTLKIISPYGCIEEITDSIRVKPAAKGVITGPADICEDTYATFSATANSSNSLEWKWQFANSNSSTEQNPPAQLFSDAGVSSVMLIVNNDGCYDTAYSTLNVHNKPVVNLSPTQPHICLNDSIQLQANNGVDYTWSPDTYISNTKIAAPFVYPKSNTSYIVDVVDNYGCANRDSVTVLVTQPFNVNIQPEVYVCRGSSIQLNAEGADKYVWINGTGLNNTQIANPVATTDTEKSYTVVGYDNYGCFTDTAVTKIKIAPLPSVDAGVDITVAAGTEAPLQAVASNDVVKWNWQPADYLSCTNCATPVSTPRSDIMYIAEVTNNYGCTKKDSVKINIICKQSLVFIPNAFTPNGDNNNERFAIIGNGIKLIKHLIIFDRWGKRVFEKSNFENKDPKGSWDGKHNGEPMPTGTYVYIAELICDAGEVFNFKGTVTLIR